MTLWRITRSSRAPSFPALAAAPLLITTGRHSTRCYLRIAVDIAAKNGRAAIRGWTEETDAPALDLARACEGVGAAVVIYTDILRDGTQEGVNIKATRELARGLGIPVIASGGVSTIRDIESLRPLEEDGVIGVITGRALYEGTLDLAEAIAKAK